jgi:hypothetical protein
MGTAELLIRRYVYLAGSKGRAEKWGQAFRGVVLRGGGRAYMTLRMGIERGRAQNVVLLLFLGWSPPVASG